MHRLQRFKGFLDTTIDLTPNLTVLIGPNGIGKTNLIEAIELLAYVVSGQPVHSITDIGRGGGFEVRGGLQSCARRGDTTFELSFSSLLDFEGERVQVAYSVSVRATPVQEIEGELLLVGDRRLFAAGRERAGLLSVTWDNFKQGKNKPIAHVPSTQSVISQYATFASDNRKYAPCLDLINALKAFLSRSYVFDPHPRLMREYDRVGNTVLQRDGANLSAVLHGLSVGGDQDRAALDRITTRIRQVPEERFDDIGFEVTRLNDVIFGLRSGAALTDARVLSDGTLRALAVLTALETCAQSSRLVVEEFDNGIHPTRVRGLFESILEAATRRQLNVIVTTHNPATLDAMPAAALRGVVLAHWDVAQRSAQLTPLLALSRVGEVLERGRLGDLVTKRILETYLEPVTEAERRAQAREWLGALP